MFSRMPSPSQPRALFVQPFGLASSGGGSRILRSMVRGQPFAARSLNCDPYPGPASDWIEEKHLAVRPALGRLDRTRFARLGHPLEIPARPFFTRRLAREMDAAQPDVVHVLPHWTSDFHLAWRLARKARRRVVMSVHDDLAYTLPRDHPLRKEALEMLGRMWTDVDHVFAISQELGDEYNARYGRRSFEIVTDGLETIAPAPQAARPSRLKVYFMGLFHYTYRDNLRALTRALAQLQAAEPGLKIELVMRCGGFEKGIDAAFPAQTLPFADQATVLRDMETADLLYMPLPFGEEHASFARFSLSTKMVSYLGSGVPILFHGPRESAAAGLLERNRAALACHSLDEAELASLLSSSALVTTRTDTVTNALQLARCTFPLPELRRKFLRGLFPERPTGS
jgi:hypothetical protein